MKVAQRPKLVIIGAGFGGINLVQGLRNSIYDVTIIDKNNFHNFQPLLYQVASGALSPDAITYPVRRMIQGYESIHFAMTEVLYIEPKKNHVVTTAGIFTYDYLCIATGAQTNFFGNNAFEDNSLSLKSIEDALSIRNHILGTFEHAENAAKISKENQPINFVVIGGGPTGVELAGAIAEIKTNYVPKDFREIKNGEINIFLVEAGNRLLSAMSDASSVAVKRYLENLGVIVKLESPVDSFDGKTVTFKSGEQLQTEHVIWAAGVKGNALEGMEEAKVERGNRYKVDAFNRVEGFDNVFAVGDIALMTADKNYPGGHPMIATPAVQQGKHLAKNLIRLSKNKSLVPFSYFDPGTMATVGRNKAVIEVMGVKMQGFVAWLSWLFLHLMYLAGFRNRLVVFLNWMWNYVTFRNAVRVIINPERTLKVGKNKDYSVLK
jgi:NADH:ubiquinone reductase (H+-translocating)